MTDQPQNREILAEAVELCSELFKNIELKELSLADCALKAARVARLLNDEDHQRIFQYEAGGYPSKPHGVPADIFELAVRALRVRPKS